MYVIIDEPKVEGYNGSSQPVLWLTKDIMTDLLPYMNVFKDTDLATAESGEDNSNNPAEGYSNGEAALPDGMDTIAGQPATQAAGSTTQSTGSQKQTQAVSNSSSQAVSNGRSQTATKSAQKPSQSATKKQN